MNTSSSSRKVVAINISTPVKKKSLTCYRMIDIEILSGFFELMVCPSCKENHITLTENNLKKMGLTRFFLVACCKCKYSHEFCTSQTTTNIDNRRYDENLRMVYGMRACGQGYAGMEKYCTLMNMPKLITQNNYNKIVTTIVYSVKDVAEETFQDAATEIRIKKSAASDQVLDMGVSNNGSWQRRGYSSMNGFVATISLDVGKILDIEPMIRLCKCCNNPDPIQFAQWKASHTCHRNQNGSVPAMEITGSKRIFSRSVGKHNMRYLELYSKIVKDLYQAATVKKLECVVQKRVGTQFVPIKFILVE